MILASLGIIPIDLLMILTIMVVIFIPRAIKNSAANNARVNAVLRMFSVLDHLPAKVADLKKDKDALNLYLQSIATSVNDIKNKPSPPDPNTAIVPAIQLRIDKLSARLATGPPPPPSLQISDVRSLNTPPRQPTPQLSTSTQTPLVTQETTTRNAPSSVLAFSTVAQQATAIALPSSLVLAVSGIARQHTSPVEVEMAAPKLSLPTVVAQQTSPIVHKTVSMGLSPFMTVETDPREVAQQKLKMGVVMSQATEHIAS